MSVLIAHAAATWFTVGYNLSVVLRLVESWLRTAVWTARGVLVTTMLAA